MGADTIISVFTYLHVRLLFYRNNQKSVFTCLIAWAKHLWCSLCEHLRSWKLLRCKRRGLIRFSYVHPNVTLSFVIYAIKHGEPFFISLIPTARPNSVTSDEPNNTHVYRERASGSRWVFLDRLTPSRPTPSRDVCQTCLSTGTKSCSSSRSFSFIAQTEL